MVTNYIKKPFGFDLVRKIEGGDIEGFIYTRSRYEARIVEWNTTSADKKPILVAADRHTDGEVYYNVDNNGMVHAPEENGNDLELYVPDWLDASDGDIVCGVNYGDGVWRKWISVLKGDIGYTKGKPFFKSYVEIELDGKNAGELRFDTHSWHVDHASLGTESERKLWRGLLLDELRKSDHDKSDKVIEIIMAKSVIKPNTKPSSMTYDENGCIYYQQQEI